MDSAYRLSVVLCAVDETFSLRETFRGIDCFHLAYEYLFVLSRDCTPECLETVREICTRDDCRYVYQSGRGFGNAIRESMQHVQGDHMILWSADGATNADCFPELVRLSKEKPDCIVTVSRWLSADGFDGYNAVRKVVNRISQKLFAFLYRSDLTDFTNPTQIAPTALYRAIRWERNGFDLIPELTFKPLKLGVKFIEVPGKCLPRQEGRSHSRFSDLTSYYIRILQIYRMDRNDILSEKDAAE